MKPITPEQFSNFENFIQKHDAFIIAGHKEPDGDCISSSLALSDLLKKEKKRVQLVNAGPFKRPETKKYEKQFANTINQLTTKKEKTGLFIVDCSELQRLGDIAAELKEHDVFIIDHHRTASANSETSIINPAAPATAYLIQQLYELKHTTIPKETAEILFFGLCTDTGFFRFLDTTSADVFRSAARLIDQGANPRETYSFITSGKHLSTRKLLGVLLERSKSYYDGKLIITYETMKDTRELGKNGRDSDMLYQALLAVENVEAVVFIRQESENNCTVGLRSKDEINVSAVAAHFGGGGHKNAAGLSTEGKLETLEAKIVEEFKVLFEKNNT